MAQFLRKKVARTNYHVVWICPLDIELLPAVLMLDEQHEPPEIDNHSDENIYEFGSASGHNIVLATCRQGLTGNVNVSSITAPLFKTFPNIRMTLLVGIGGGVPQTETFSDPINDLRLGDVVVGWPTWADGRGAVVYYESGRSRHDGFEITGTMDKPHPVLLNALPSLKLDHDLGRSNFRQYMSKLQDHELLGNRFKHPGFWHDRLFEPTYTHVGGYKSNCKDCDSRHLVQRIPRDDSQQDLFIYHQGRIATGNSVIMDTQKRDSISEQCGGALCIEMEAAGVEVNSRCLVIRGISDYADSHKSDIWRSYAAGKATVFARTLLGKIPGRDIKERMISENKHWLVSRSTSPNFTGRLEVMSRIVKTISGENSGNCQRRFVLTGMGGQGKSEICLHVANALRDRFWGIFWVDVSSKKSADESCSEVAEALGCPKTVVAVRKALSGFPKTKQWLLVLDNADDPDTDYQTYLPSGDLGAILITSRNPQCGRLAKTGSHEELDNLEEHECIQLLQRTAQLRGGAPGTQEYKDAASLVKDLGHHTLAVLHAASYIATTHCSISEYLGFLRSNRRRLLEKPRIQGQSRYDTVYATFEASIEFLETPETGPSDETRKDSLELLKFLATSHHTSVPLDVLVDAWEGAKIALKVPEVWDMDSGLLTAWHVDQLPDFVRFEKNDVRFRIIEAVTRLESLAIVRPDRSSRAWKSVSMHPLVHGWAGDRYTREEKKVAIRMTECVIALSHLAFDTWRPYYYQLIPHLKLLVESDTELVEQAARSRPILQMCVQIAAIYYQVRLDRDMFEFASRIFDCMSLHDKVPTEHLRELYRIFAVAVDREGSRPAQALAAFEAIARHDEKIRGENEPERLRNLRDLGSAHLDNGQIKRAGLVLQRVVKSYQELGKEDEDMLAARHNLALTFLRDGQIKEAITMLGKVVDIGQRLFPVDNPDRLASQHTLAIAFLRDGQVAKAISMLEEVANCQVQSHGEEHLATVRTRNSLAGAYRQAGRSSEAIKLYERVIGTRKRILDERHPDVLMPQHDLAGAYMDIDKGQAAIELLEWVVGVKDFILDAADQSRLASQHELGRAYLEAGRASEATIVLERVVGITTSTFEATDPIRIVSQKTLSRAFLNTGRTSEAIMMLERIVEAESSLHKQDHPDMVTSQNLLHAAYDMGRRSSQQLERMPLKALDNHKLGSMPNSEEPPSPSVPATDRLWDRTSKPRHEGLLSNSVLIDDSFGRSGSLRAKHFGVLSKAFAPRFTGNPESEEAKRDH